MLGGVTNVYNTKNELIYELFNTLSAGQTDAS